MNYAQQKGGVIDASFQSVLYLNCCRFENNFAKYWGGAAYLYSNSTSEIYETDFTDNKASQGGVIYNQLNVTLCIQDGTFTSNEAEKYGGAILGTHSTIIEITFTNFSGNNIPLNDGGAIDVRTFSTLHISKCRFEDNFAKYCGGAIHLYKNTTLVMKETVFIGNKSSIWRRHM